MPQTCSRQGMPQLHRRFHLRHELRCHAGLHGSCSREQTELLLLGSQISSRVDGSC